MSEARRYRKKPVVIEAIQVTDSDSFMAAGEWLNSNDYPWLLGNATEPASLYVKDHEGEPVSTGVWIDPADGALMIRTLEGDMRVSPGDYVIRGVQGEFYPCKPNIFAQTYELIPTTEGTTR